MRLRTCLVMAFAAYLLPLSAMAAGGRVASVDYQRLVKEAPQIKASNDLLDKEFAPRKKAIEQQKKQIASLRKRYLALGPGDNSLKLASAREKFEDAGKKLAKLEQDYTTRLALRRHQLSASFKGLVKETVHSYATAHGFSIVVRDGIVYAGAGADITDRILYLLEKDYREVQSAAHEKGRQQ